MERVSNCINCGAVMEYSKQDYGNMYKCPYCGTEHHIDLLGRIEEYKVKFMFMGHIFEAYLISFAHNPSVIEYDLIGSGRHYISGPSEFEFNFVGTICEEGE